MPLYSLVYISIASQEMDDESLKNLLNVARKNNESHGITGILLYREKFFIQALEGEQNALETLFEKIKVDNRHYNVLTIYQQPIEKREFPQWSMGFATANLAALKQIAGFSDFMLKPQLGKFGQLALKLGSEVNLILDKFRR